MTRAFNFQKRPYRAVCVQWNGNNAAEIFKLLENTKLINSVEVFREEFIFIRYAGGTHTLKRSDWVIKGEDGVARIYTDEVFQIKYEALAA